MWRLTVVFGVFCAFANAHSTHHVEEQEPFSQERLEELERKWGTDVCIFILSPFIDTDIHEVGILWRVDVCTSSSHSMSDTSRD
jgi:hypothetical protein